MKKKSRGTTLVEMLAAMTVIGLLVGVAGIWLKPMEAPLRSSVVLSQAFLRQARVTAMATTSAYRVRGSSERELIAETAASCTATTWTADDRMRLVLPDPVTLSETSWEVCFSARGMSQTSVQFGLSHPDLGEERIEVLRGGTTRVLP